MERETQRKVFSSYRSTDRAVVAEFAERLRRDGVDARFDCWEVAAGDDIVARMDEGIGGLVDYPQPARGAHPLPGADGPDPW